MFARRSFAASSALLFLSGLGMFGPMLLLPLYFQQERGQSVIAAGLLLVPQGLDSLLARPVGALADRIGPRPVILASSTTRIVQQLGSSFGTAVLAVLLQRELDSHPGAAGMAVAFDHTFAWTLAFTAVALLPALLLPRRSSAEDGG